MTIASTSFSKSVYTGLLLILLLTASSAAQSHNSFANQLQVVPGNGYWLLKWTAPVDELNRALGLDRDQNQLIHWWEIEARKAAIAQYAREHFACKPRLACGPLQLEGELELLPLSPINGARLLISFSLPVYGDIDGLSIDWFLDHNSRRSLVMQWFTEGQWQDERVFIGADIDIGATPGL